MANPFRSEIEIVIDGVTYKVRCNFNLIAEIEDACGPILALSTRIRAMAFKHSEIAKLLMVAVRRCDNAPKDPGAFLDRLIEIGVLNYLKDASAILTNALSTGDGPKNEQRGNTAN